MEAQTKSVQGDWYELGGADGHLHPGHDSSAVLKASVSGCSVAVMEIGCMDLDHPDSSPNVLLHPLSHLLFKIILKGK